MIDFDVESTGVQPWSGAQEAFLYIFMGDDLNPEVIRNDEPNWRERVQAWFDRGKAEGIRAWNSNFDRAFADAGGFDVPGDGLWRDGMVEAHAVDERRSVALKSVSRELFGDDADDLQKQVKAFLNEERRKRAKIAKEAGEELVEPNYSDVPDELIRKYGAEDVILTRKVDNVYAPVIAQSPDLTKLVQFERDAMDALYHVTKRGLPADAHGYRMLEGEVTDNLEVLHGRCLELAAEGGVETFNPNSSIQIYNALKARGADMTYTSQEDGKIKMDADNLRAIDDDLAVAILEYRSERLVHSTYVRPMISRHHDTGLRAWKEPFIGPDGRIHATYRQVGARTGRMSCADPNMQNQPRDDLRLRYNIVAPEGHKIVTCDLNNIEMVLFAAYAGPGRLLETIREGGDLHALTARMLGLRDRRRPGGGIETARQLGKVYNFTKIYGGGHRSVRRYFRVPMEESRRMQRAYENAYPEVVELKAVIHSALERNGYVQDKLISGRRFRVDVRDSYKAVNYLVQGTAAALLKWAMIGLHKEGIPMVALVHDEILACVPEAEAEETRDRIIHWLTAFEINLPDGPVPLNAEGDIVDRWSDAKPLKDEEGPYLFTPEWAGGERRRLAVAA
jgi:DNA polymerase I-like protein with 3'-5' exonuclease and polymerase domains